MCVCVCVHLCCRGWLLHVSHTGFHTEHDAALTQLAADATVQAEEAYQHEAATGASTAGVENRKHNCVVATRNPSHTAALAARNHTNSTARIQSHNSITHGCINTDNAPPERAITVPPRSWVDDMRTPAPEVVLAEFQRQKSLLAAAGALLQGEGRVDGGGFRSSKENTDTNGAEQAAEASATTSRIPKLLRGAVGDVGFVLFLVCF